MSGQSRVEVDCHGEGRLEFYRIASVRLAACAVGCRPMARATLSLGSEEEDKSDEHQWHPNPRHSTERQLPEVETDESRRARVGSTALR